MSLETLNHLDPLTGIRNGIRTVAGLKGEWAGIPLPLEGERLIIDPSYAFADALSKLGAEVEEDEEIPEVRNVFWSRRHRRNVIIWQEDDGRITKSWMPGVGHLDQELKTLSCSSAWGIEQEHAALMTLAEFVSHHKFKQYLLTGSFLETSRRSGVSYLFRKLRPTVALRAPKVLCTLCMHPIAYYDESWAGAMTPTDDVVAHLMLMRGDEHMFWRRCNQHQPDRPEAGL